MQNYENAMNDGCNSEIKSQIQNVITVLQTEKTADALNSAQEHMVGLIMEIAKTSKELGHAVDSFTSNFAIMETSISNVSIAVNEIAENTTTQAQSTNEASDSVGEIADGIEDTSKEVFSLEENLKAMEEYSNKSMDALTKLIEVNTKTKADIDSMYKQTENTNETESNKSPTVGAESTKWGTYFCQMEFWDTI